MTCMKQHMLCASIACTLYLQEASLGLYVVRFELLVHFLMLQILALAHNKQEIESRVHAIIDKFAERGLRSLAVARQVNSSGDFYCSRFIKI